jgi:hypothetical protein
MKRSMARLQQPQRLDAALAACKSRSARAAHAEHSWADAQGILVMDCILNCAHHKCDPRVAEC